MEDISKKDDRQQLLFAVGKALGKAGKKAPIDDYKNDLKEAAGAFEHEREEAMTKLNDNADKITTLLRGIQEKVNLRKDTQVKDLIDTFNELGKLFTPATQAQPVLLQAANELRDKIIDQHRSNMMALLNMEDEINEGVERLKVIIADTAQLIEHDKTAFIHKVEQIEQDHQTLMTGHLFGTGWQATVSGDPIAENV